MLVGTPTPEVASESSASRSSRCGAPTVCMVGPDSVNSLPSMVAASSERPLTGSNVTSRTIGNPTPIDSISGMFWTLQLKSDRPSGAIVNAPAWSAASPAAGKLNVKVLPSRVKPSEATGATPACVSVTKPAGTVEVSIVRPPTGSSAITTVSPPRSATPSALPPTGDSSRALPDSRLKVPSVTAAALLLTLSCHEASRISTLPVVSAARLPNVKANVLPASRVTPVAVARSTPPWKSVTRSAVTSPVSTLWPATGAKTTGTLRPGRSAVPIVSGSAPSRAVGAAASVTVPRVRAAPALSALSTHAASRISTAPGVSAARGPKLKRNVLPDWRATAFAVALSTPPWNSVTLPAVMSAVSMPRPETGTKATSTVNAGSWAGPTIVPAAGATSSERGASALNEPSVVAAAAFTPSLHAPRSTVIGPATRSPRSSSSASASTGKLNRYVLTAPATAATPVETAVTPPWVSVTRPAAVSVPRLTPSAGVNRTVTASVPRSSVATAPPFRGTTSAALGSVIARNVIDEVAPVHAPPSASVASPARRPARPVKSNR